MQTALLKATPVTELMYKKLRSQISEFQKSRGRPPKLATVLVGEDPASKIYVKKKGSTCESLGMLHSDYKLSTTISESELLKIIQNLNEDDLVDGILVQSPLPGHIDEKKIFESIDPQKDVDCFSPKNIGLLIQNRSKILPCTPGGIMELLRFYKIDVSGKRALVVGRSDIVGKPMALLLLHANATVTIAHSKTSDLQEHLRTSQLVIAAIGKRGILTKNLQWHPDATVIDVGIHRTSEGSIVGDCDDLSGKVANLTPVPGGVGPLTIAYLMVNTVQCAKLRIKQGDLLNQ